MALKIDFQVHRVQQLSTKMKVQLNGKDIVADVPAVEVELETVDERHGSLVLRFVAEEAADALAIFKAGETVSWPIASAPAPAAE